MTNRSQNFESGSDESPFSDEDVNIQVTKMSPSRSQQLIDELDTEPLQKPSIRMTELKRDLQDEMDQSHEIVKESKNSVNQVLDFMSKPTLQTPHWNKNGTNEYTSHTQIMVCIPGSILTLIILIIYLIPLMSNSIITSKIEQSMLNHGVPMVNNSTYQDQIPIGSTFSWFYRRLNDLEIIVPNQFNATSMFNDMSFTFNQTDSQHLTGQPVGVTHIVKYQIIKQQKSNQKMGDYNDMVGTLSPDQNDPSQKQTYDLSQIIEHTKDTPNMMVPDQIYLYVFLPNNGPNKNRFNHINISVNKTSPYLHSSSERPNEEQFLSSQNTYSMYLDALTHNTYDLKMNQLIVQEKQKFGATNKIHDAYYVADHYQDMTPELISSLGPDYSCYCVQMTLKDKILITNAKAQFQDNMGKIGGLLGLLIAFMYYSMGMLGIKYQNHQAKIVQAFQDRLDVKKILDCDFADLDGSMYQKKMKNKAAMKLADFRNNKKYMSKWSYKLSHQYWSQWCCVRKEQRLAVEKMGQKLSWISLYEYVHLIDEHQDRITTMKNKIEEMKVIDQQKDQELSDQRYIIQNLMERVSQIEKNIKMKE